MSVDKNYYVIGGYDLTDFKTDKYDDWKWTNQGEEYTCNQTTGQIQLFDDPMDNSYLYLGYIFASGDEYDFDTVHFDLLDAELCRDEIEAELPKLADMGIISKAALEQTKFKIIVFAEST